MIKESKEEIFHKLRRMHGEYREAKNKISQSKPLFEVVKNRSDNTEDLITIIKQQFLDGLIQKGRLCYRLQ